MIHNLNGSGRRILTYPAVYSCDTIAPSTLINNLITLAHTICGFKSKFFASNKRNALETFRQIENILIFLEEIRDGSSDSDLPDSVVLSLSELHLSFQKVLYLLEDCTRDGARLWMLMESDRVANQFRVLIRAISTGLDVFPIGSVNVSVEVKELVEFIARQTRKARFEVDPDDKRVINDVIRILDRFKNRVDPEKSEIKRVLDYIGIWKWRECNKEIKLMDGEIELEISNEAKKKETEFSLLSSLNSFMCYCRCVIFDFVDGTSSSSSSSSSEEANHQHVKTKCNSEEVVIVSGLNVDDLRCPISFETMKDPVTLLSTGHTYDRVSISKWFRAGNATCPNTGKKLTSTELVPNVVVKRIIQQYCGGGGGKRDLARNRIVVAGSLAAEGAFKMVAGFLADKLGNGTCGDRNKAAFEIRLLTKTSVFNRSCLVEAGAIPHLLNLMVSNDSLAQENAIAALLNLSKHSKSKSIIVENGGLELVLYVLNKGVKIEARQHAAATLFYLASVEEYRKLIGETPEAIPALVELIKEGNGRSRKNALVAIFGLLMHSGNHRRVLESGVVPLLVDLLTSSDREDVVTDSLAVLVTLAENPDGTNAIMRRGALNTIVGILDSSTCSRAGKEYCVSLLLALCINGGANVVALLVKSPPLMGSLYSLISEGTSRASKKANALIKLLHEFYERRSSGLMASVLPQERFIHVW